MAPVMEVGGQRVAVSAGGLHAGVDAPGPLPLQPPGELREAGRGVGEGAVAGLTALADEAGVELEFRDVDAERW
jgi:hypothetical protein